MRNIRVIIFLLIGCFLGVKNTYAMHISEGILPFNWAALWFAVGAPFFAYGLYKLKKISGVDLSFKPLVGLMTAVVFIISCMPIPVPTAGTCSHPCATAISGIILGPGISILVTAAALLIQALFLAHGGLSTLGANIVSMGIAGSFTGFLTFKVLRAIKINITAAGFMAGLFADWATYITTAAELALGLKGSSEFMPLFCKILIAFVPTQVPLGILEGAMTAGMVTLLYKKRPDLLVKMRVVKTISIILFVAYCLFSTKLVRASAQHPNLADSLVRVSAQEQKWPGVDKTVVEKYAKEHGREARKPLINTDQGDLLLFVFLLAGTAGGFAAGYCWRALIKK